MSEVFGLNSQDFILIVAGAVCLWLIVRWLSPKPAAKQVANKGGKTPSFKKPEPRLFTRQEVSKHNKREDCWLVVNKRVYDVTSYVDFHIGGDAILNNAGGENTDAVFGEQHPGKVREMIEEYYVGWVEE